MTDKAVQTIDKSQHAPTVAPEPQSFLERVALDTSIDLDRLKEVMAIQKEINRENAEKAFSEAMAAAQAEMPQVARDADNEQTRSKYARLEAIDAAITPVITKHGFSTSFSTGRSDLPGYMLVRCKLRHSGGYSEAHDFDIPIDDKGMKGTVNKTATHAFGSTTSYGRRYAKLMLFDIALKNEDDDGNAAGDGELITDGQRDQLQDLIDETEADIVKFCNIWKIEALADLPLSKFGAALKRLEERKAKRDAANADI